jgi:hypothetical protein
MTRGASTGQKGALSAGQSLSTGPTGGIGAGQRDRGTPEPGTFQRDKISAKELSPSGQTVGSFVVEGPSDPGEATLQKGGAIEKAVRDLSQQVDREPLPVEKREQIERFHELLLGGKASSGEK